MSVVMEVESTEYIYVGVAGTVPDSAEMAFMSAGARPTDADWHDATLVTSITDPLWNDAKNSGATGDYFLAVLIGSFVGTSGTAGVTLAADDWQVWVRLTGPTERPVRIAPTTLEIS